MPGRKVLLVEGIDDEHVIKHICGNRGIPNLDEVNPQGGVPELLEAVPIQLRTSSEEGDVVGVVIDADTNLDARWRSIRDLFLKAGYQDVPANPDPNGTIFEPPADSVLPRAGVWIMPDNKTCGILEDFLRFLVPQPNALLDHAISSVKTVPEQCFSDQDRPKALIHTWLAWQEEPGKPYGTAITARFLDPGVPEADVLVSWLRRLFFQP